MKKRHVASALAAQRRRTNDDKSATTTPTTKELRLHMPQKKWQQIVEPADNKGIATGGHWQYANGSFTQASSPADIASKVQPLTGISGPAALDPHQAVIYDLSLIHI